MAGWATQWDQCATSPARQAMASTAFAAHFSVRAATAFHARRPRGWSHAEAATITTAGVTAWRALVGDGQIKTGDTVLVLGTGGVSNRRAADREDDGCGGYLPRRRLTRSWKRVRTLGANHVINYRQSPGLGEGGCETSQDGRRRSCR